MTYSHYALKTADEYKAVLEQFEKYTKVIKQCEPTEFPCTITVKHTNKAATIVLVKEYQYVRHDLK